MAEVGSRKTHRLTILEAPDILPDHLLISKLGQPCDLDSFKNSSIVRPRGAIKSGFPETESKYVVSPSRSTSVRKLVDSQYPAYSA